MKLTCKLNGGRVPRSRSGYTLVEMMVASAVYLFLLVGVVVSIQLFALRIYTLAATKLTATQGARKALNQMRDDIRQGKRILVGNADNSGTFTAYGGTNDAVGNALQVFYQTNLSAPYSLYYLQTNLANGTSSNNLVWVSVTSNLVKSVNLATYITNLDIFAAEDWNNWQPTNGSLITVSNNVLNNQVYSVKMQFWQWEYPIAVVGGVGLNAYDYFQLRTRVCRRATD